MIFYRVTYHQTKFTPQLPRINPDEVQVFATNIGTAEESLLVRKLLLGLNGVKECGVDIEDCDKVLRVVGSTSANDIKGLVDVLGFEIDELTK